LKTTTGSRKRCGITSKLVLSVQDGRETEGVELLRHALSAAPFTEHDCGKYELGALGLLVEVLFKQGQLEEVEPLVLRYREAARRESRTRDPETGGLVHVELDSLYYSARLHEAHGRPLEAAEDVRALLALLRENPRDVRDMLSSVESTLSLVFSNLKILSDPALRDKELAKAVSVQLAKLRVLLGSA